MIGRLLRIALFLIVSFLLGGVDNALAQDGFDAHGFSMAAQDGDLRDPIGMVRAGRFHQGEFWATSVFEIADAPLVLIYHYPDNRPDRIDTLLDDVYAMNFSVGGALHDYLRLDLGIPLFLSSTGADAEGRRVDQGTAVGDMRLTLTTPIVRPSAARAGGFGLAIAPYFDLPTGNPELYLGQPKLAGGGVVSTTFEAGSLTLTGVVGPHFTPDPGLTNLTGTDHLLAGFGLGYMVGDVLGATVELRTLRPLSANAEKGTDSPSELLGSIRTRLRSGPHLTIGGATALSRGAGAASWRFFVGVGYGRVQTNFGDSDGDGVADEQDKCPKEKEVMNSYQDEDGCPDEGGRLLISTSLDGYAETDVVVRIHGGSVSEEVVSALKPIPLEVPAGMYRLEATLPGFQVMTQAVVESGVVQATVVLQAVEPGTLGITLIRNDGGSLYRVGLSLIGPLGPEPSHTLNEDGLAPLEMMPGEYMVFLKTKDGAMFRGTANIGAGQHTQLEIELRLPRAKVSGDRIDVDGKVYFEVSSATIKPESFGLLDEIAALLLEHEELTKIEVQGHTDDQGGELENLQLSQSRAESVRAYMIEKGLPEARLDAAGYGEGFPIADNTTAEGRATNRRVEFVIVQRR